ncbi:BTAD domain-containing putative transcriptional regulator [Streptomyces sp. NPDC127033]|uniref:AfsR/SARP family transcriptional regulator n=1 Tax=Streptomyces sp. NPDC127033 TaxID=3347110 RepID=UPI003656CE76
MDLHVLGRIRALDEEQERGLGGMRPRTLLAALLLAGEQGLSQTEIHRALWGSAPPATVRAQIHTYVSRLRRALGGEVQFVRRPNGYALLPHDVTVDYQEFLRLSARGRESVAAGDVAEGKALYQAALGQWSGAPLTGATEFLDEVESPRLNELRLSVTEEKAAADLALGLSREVVGELTPLVEQFPFRERLRSQLMTALYQGGRQADAIAVYRQGRRVLAENLGVDPGEELDSTFHALLSGTLDVHPLATGTPRPAERVAEPGSARLPPDLVDFVGRGAELKCLGVWLTSGGTAAGADPVVITGTAGTGKTVLAVRAAHAAAANLPDGQLHVSFRDAAGRVRPVAEVLDELLRGLGGRPDPGTGVEDRLWLIRRRLAEGRRLVVLDDVGADVPLGPLVSPCGGTRFLITGRPRFAELPGVHVMVLGGLPRHDAVRLLTGIAGHSLSAAADRDAVERLVRLCEWHPAAIRAVGALLVARPHWTAARLARRMADPRRNLLELLHVGTIDVGKSLRRAYEELPERLRSALPRLAAISEPGISIRSAALAWGLPEGEAEDMLERLVDAHMLTVTGVGDDGLFRFGISGLLRGVLGDGRGPGPADSPAGPVEVGLEFGLVASHFPR